MKVNLKRTWFGPTASTVPAGSDKNCPVVVSGKRYRTRDNPHNFPESYRAILPRDAEILDKPVVEKPIEDPRVEKLSDHDISRAAAEAEGAVIAAAAPAVPPVVRRRQG